MRRHGERGCEQRGTVDRDIAQDIWIDLSSLAWSHRRDVISFSFVTRRAKIVDCNHDTLGISDESSHFCFDCWELSLQPVVNDCIGLAP